MNIEKLVAGDTLDFNVAVPDYPASAGWTLKYRLAARDAAGTAVTLTATTNADGETYDVQAAPATTAAWVPGYYTWSRWVEKSGARQTLDESGQLEIKADPSALAAGTDTRSTARKALDDLKAAYATFNTTGGRVTAYTIGGRSMSFESSSEILKAMNFWQRQVNNEEAADRLAVGAKSPNKLFIRLG